MAVRNRHHKESGPKAHRSFHIYAGTSNTAADVNAQPRSISHCADARFSNSGTNVSTNVGTDFKPDAGSFDTSPDAQITDSSTSITYTNVNADTYFNVYAGARHVDIGADTCSYAGGGWRR